MINYFNEAAVLFTAYQKELTDIPIEIKDKVTDICLHIGQPPYLFLGRERYTLDNLEPISEIEMENIVFRLCDYSVYKHVEEIKNGFISVRGRYRVGICGTAVTTAGQTDNIKNITALVMRIPRTIYGAADELVGKVKDLYKGVLIYGEPSSGKTTLLRDLISVLSEKRLVVLDERFELTGGDACKSLNVLYGYPKKIGIGHAIRNLGAEIIICDELEKNDIEAVESAVPSGVALIATVHGAGGLAMRPLVSDLVKTGAFGKIIGLKGRDGPCEIGRIWEAGELLENCRGDNNRFCWNHCRLYKGAGSQFASREIEDIS